MTFRSSGAERAPFPARAEGTEVQADSSTGIKAETGSGSDRPDGGIVGAVGIPHTQSLKRSLRRTIVQVI